MRNVDRYTTSTRFAIVTAFSSIALGAGLAAPLPVAAAAPDCTSSYDPYSASATTLVACGLNVYPLQRTDIAASGPTAGATLFHYDVDGAAVTALVPPPTFSPTVASPQQLAAFGIPTEPTDAVGRARWLQMARNYHPIRPPTALIEDPKVTAPLPAATNFANSRWAGIVNTSTGPSPYTQSAAGWTEPAATAPPGCPMPSAVYWAGLGGRSTGVLAQSGTAQGVPGLANGQAWEQVPPAQPGIVPVPMIVPPGDIFETGTQYLGANKFAFAFVDLTTGATFSIQAQNSGYDGHTSDFIAERPTYGNQLFGLLNFGNVAFWATKTNNMTSGSFPHEADTMTNGAPVPTNLAVPHNYVASNGSFNVQWLACT